jgi:flavin-dependent dehydrogenase
VGDAAYYKDPLPGQGIHDALRSTELATDAFFQYRAGGSSGRAWDTAFRKYHATRDRETKPMYDLTDYYAHLDRKRTPQEMDLFRALAGLPEWSNRYVSLFNGVTDVKWFRRFDTLTRILLAWRWKQFKEKFRG